jgi:type-2 restriction enzyme hinfI
MPFNEKESLHKFNTLLNDIIEAEQDSTKSEKISHDVDLLFYQNSTKQYVYTEVKYNDDHDTGKFIDINRKFLLSYALLVNELNIKKVNQLKPILMYFNNKKMKGNIYVPEQTNIFRGERFFSEFTTISYSEIDTVFSNISEDPCIIKKFDELCKKILNENY